jgi:Zn-dependent protease
MGVPIQIGPSILFLVLIFVSIGSSPDEMFYDVFYLCLLVGSILAHELGHAWGCLIQGIPVRRVMLNGGGGFCEHRRSLTSSEDELIVAMGPIVNLLIWIFASFAAPLVGHDTLHWALLALADLNLFLALFNLLPVNPLDGGKLFHLLMMRLFPWETATRITGWVGVAMTILWVPMMIVCFIAMGFVLIFLPSFREQWDMARLAR